MGAGAVSQIFYLPLFARGMAGLRLVGIVDPDPPDEAFASGVSVHRDSFEAVFANAALMADVDAVLVALPHHLHARCVQAALAQGKHVFCEKPLALSQAELDEIEEADPRGERVLAICQPRRQFAAASAVARLVREGALGRPVRVAWREGQPYAWPAASISQILAEHGGSELFDIGAHVFDLLSWWFGPLNVIGYADDAAGGTAAEFSIDLHGESELPVRVQLSRLHRLENVCEIGFERGSLRWHLASPGTVELLGGDLAALGPVRLTPVPNEAPSTMIDAIAADLRQFAAAVSGGPRSNAGLPDARRVARIFDACRARVGAPDASASASEGVGYLVTGAAGFIGCALVEALVARRQRVHALVHTPKNSVRLARLGAPMSKADILRPETFAALIPRDGVVLHCAVSHASPRTSVVDGTMTVLRAAHSAGARRVVILSSMLAMGDPPAEGSVDELTPLPQSPMAYAAAKAEMERAALEFGRSSGLEVVILRPTCVFGPYGSDFGSAHLDAMAAQTYFYVEQGRGRANLVYVDNLVDAILLAATAPGIAGECFLVNEEERETTWGEYFSDLANAAFGSSAWPSFSAAEVGDLKAEWSRRNRFPGVLRNAVRAHPATREWLAANPLFRGWQKLRRLGRYSDATAELATSSASDPIAPCVEDRKALLRERLVGDRRCFYDASYGLFFASRAVYRSAEARRRLGWAPRVGREEAMEATRAWVRRAYGQASDR